MIHNYISKDIHRVKVYMFKSSNLQQEHLHISPFHLFKSHLNTLKLLSSLRTVGKLFYNKMPSDLKDFCPYLIALKFEGTRKLLLRVLQVCWVLVIKSTA